MSQNAQPTAPFAHLSGHNYMNLTTFRKSGVEVTTPVWFAQIEDRIYVVTDGNSGKAKRLRNNGAVKIGPSDARGKPLGESEAAHCRILPDSERDVGLKALQKKYGWQLRAFQLLWMVRRIQEVILEIRPTSPGDKDAA